MAQAEPLLLSDVAYPVTYGVLLVAIMVISYITATGAIEYFNSQYFDCDRGESFSHFECVHFERAQPPLSVIRTSYHGVLAMIGWVAGFDFWMLSNRAEQLVSHWNPDWSALPLDAVSNVIRALYIEHVVAFTLGMLGLACGLVFTILTLRYLLAGSTRNWLGQQIRRRRLV